jgi:tetratricopeptide (TPR) repeat protein
MRSFSSACRVTVLIFAALASAVALPRRVAAKGLVAKDSAAKDGSRSHGSAPFAQSLRTLPVTTDSVPAKSLFEQAFARLEDLRTEEALKGFRAATTKDPNFVQALSLVACLTTNPAEEMTSLSRAQVLQGRVTPGERLLIQWLSGVRGSRYSQGIVAMNDLLSMYPEDRRLAFLAGRWLIQQQRYEHAQMLLENAVAQDPDYPPVLNELGYAYAFSGQFKKAISTMQRYVQLEPAQPSPEDSYAEVLRLSGDFKGALNHYRQALKLDPQFVNSQTGLADTYAVMGDEKRAREEYSKAILAADSESDRLEYELRSAMTFVREHRYVEADQAFRAAAAQAHDDGLGRLEAEAYRTMAMYGPRLESVFNNLEQAALALHRRDIARSDVDEEQARILRTLAERHVEVGNLGLARTAVQQLETMASSNRSHAVQLAYHAAAGAVLMHEGQYSQAIAHLQADRDNAMSLERLWQAYEKTGAHPEAQAVSSKGVAFNQPTIEQALLGSASRASIGQVESQP